MMDPPAIGRMVILAGVLLVVVGIVLVLANKLPWLGRLPGDLVLHRDGFTIWVPIATMLLASLLLTLLVNLVLRLWR